MSKRHPHSPWLLFTALLTIAASASQAAEPTGSAHGAFLGARNTEYPHWFKHSFLELEEDVAEAAAAGKQLIILFYQDGCPYCHALVQQTLTQAPAERRIRQHFDLVAINIWGDREVLSVDGKQFSEKQFAAGMQVQFTPTLVFLDAQGQQTLRLNGLVPPQRFDLALDYVIDKAYRQGSFRDFLASRPQVPAVAAAALSAPAFRQPKHGLDQIPQGRPIALFFEQPDCPACERLHAGLRANRQIRDSLERFHAVQLDMWSQQPLTWLDGSKSSPRQLADRYDIKYAPTILLLDPQGREIIRNEAEFKAFHTLGIFDYAAGQAWRDQPNFQRWLEARADQLRAQGIDVNIWD
jgi:thioredoxin-related protein